MNSPEYFSEFEITAPISTPNATYAAPVSVATSQIKSGFFSAAIPSIAPCTLTPEEGESLIRDFMRDNNVILFLKEEFEENELDNCNGKIIGTNVPQGSVMTTGDTLVFVISKFTDNS